MVRFKGVIRSSDDMIIEQDALELETIASIKSGQFRFVDENDVGYFIGEVMEYQDDKERVLKRILDVWWENPASTDKPLPDKEAIQEYWDSYYHTVGM
jgi:hypothetical protein